MIPGTAISIFLMMNGPQVFTETVIGQVFSLEYVVFHFPLFKRTRASQFPWWRKKIENYRAMRVSLTTA